MFACYFQHSDVFVDEMALFPKAGGLVQSNSKRCLSLCWEHMGLVCCSVNMQSGG